MASQHGSRPIQILIGLTLLSLLAGIFYVGATLPPSEPLRPVEEARPKQEPPEWGGEACEIPMMLYEAIPPRVEELCSIARGVAERIPIGTIVLPFHSRDGHAVAEGRVVARDFGCSPEGLHAALIIKPVRRQRLPVLSSYDFVDRWVAGVEAWGVDTSAEPAIRRLMIAWDEGRDVRGTSLARLAGSWDYRPWDGGVQGDVVYEAETFSRASLTKHVAAITRDGAIRWPAAPAQPP
jgi:hypothetical protein